MQMSLASRLIFSVIGTSLPIAAHAADMNETHIYNPSWPPHAKFHVGQTLSLSLLLGGLTLFFAWKPTKNLPAMVAGAGLSASAYFLTQATAIFYPNTAFFDPDVAKQNFLKLPAPVAIVATYLAATCAACWLGMRNLQD
jgi:hypothetical protein